MCWLGQVATGEDSSKAGRREAASALGPPSPLPTALFITLLLVTVRPSRNLATSSQIVQNSSLRQTAIRHGLLPFEIPAGSPRGRFGSRYSRD